MLAEGTRLQGRYTIREILGQGGMGAVYSAHDASLGDRLVAIKSLHVPLKDPADRARAVDLFRAEARLLAALDHPHIVQIMHCFEEDGKHYLVMVYVDGTTMERLIETSHPLPMPQILGWADQLADALEYLHGLKPPIIFRDLKPGNVMIDHRGHVRLIDFGIARLFTPTTQTNTLIKGAGTAGFAPLEQYSGSTDPRSDVYALGATLHVMLTGEVPPMPMSVLMGETLPPIHQLRPDTPPYLEALVMGMLGVKPDARPQTMAAVRQALKERSQPAPAHRACPTCGGLLRRDTVCRRCAPEPVRLAPRPAPAEAEKAAALDFSPQRAELAFAHGDDLCWWDVSTGQPAGKVTVPGGVRDLAWSPDGRSMATAGRTLLLWYERERLRALEGHEGAVLAVAFSPTDWLLASGSVDQHVVLWDWNSGQLLCRLPGHTQPVWGVAFSPDGRLFASASQDHSIRLWSAPEGRLVRVLEGHADWVWDLAFAPDGHTLASASFDRTVRLWPIDRKWTRFFGESSPRVVTFRTPLMSVRFCPVDSHRLAVGGWDGVVHLWDRRQEKELARLEGHEAAVGRMAWSPDGRLLAAAGLGSSVRLWDPANGHLMSVVR